jgi:hypothetical protein
MHSKEPGNGKKHLLVQGERKGLEKNMAGDSRVSHHIPKKEITKRNNIILFVCVIQEGYSGFRHRFAFDL